MKKEIRQISDDGKTCVECSVQFMRPKCYSDLQWETRKYCSPPCARKNYSDIRKRQWQSADYRRMMSDAHIGQKAWNKGMKFESHRKWKGSANEYVYLHRWVRKNLGTPTHCSKCNTEGGSYQIHWANKSQQYLRDLTDWIALCVKCHRAYDSSQPSL